MIALLLFIILAAANPCPYCKWDSCQLTEGSLPNCTSCYDIAALVPIKIDYTLITVCQLCPDHCSACEFAVQSLAFASSIPVINCTKCLDGYINNNYNGSCVGCPSNCEECECDGRGCPVTHCIRCDNGYTLVNDTSCVKNQGRRLYSGV